jgi:hypothetical protein
MRTIIIAKMKSNYATTLFRRKPGLLALYIHSRYLGYAIQEAMINATMIIVPEGHRKNSEEITVRCLQ